MAFEGVFSDGFDEEVLQKFVDYLGLDWNSQLVDEVVEMLIVDGQIELLFKAPEKAFIRLYKMISMAWAIRDVDSQEELCGRFGYGLRQDLDYGVRCDCVFVGLSVLRLCAGFEVDKRELILGCVRKCSDDLKRTFREAMLSDLEIWVREFDDREEAFGLLRECMGILLDEEIFFMAEYYEVSRRIFSKYFVVPDGLMGVF